MYIARGIMRSEESKSSVNSSIKVAQFTIARSMTIANDQPHTAHIFDITNDGAPAERCGCMSFMSRYLILQIVYTFLYFNKSS